MPSFFPFTPGQESRARFQPESSPLLGRFRAVPPSTARRPSHGALGLPSSALGNGRGSVHVGCGAVLAAGLDDDDDDDDDDVQAALDDAHNEGTGLGRRIWRKTVDVWIEPKQGAVRRVVDVWWSRYGVLVVLPAVLAIGWCALPFPQYPLLDDGDGNDHHGGDGVPSDAPTRKTPGHGQPRVRVNFWFFLFVYYNFYNLTALIWITKVFNLYSLNWWPQSLGFLPTISLIATLALVLPIPIYLTPETRFLTVHNTSWIAWTFIVMAAPVAIAFLILTTSQRHHLGLRNRIKARSYFMLTYQTYVRALYARLRSPQQFVLLQILSSSFLILLTPLTMSPLWHRVSRALNFTDQSYASYQKVCTRNVFIRFLAENVSMAAFLGSVLVLHFGPNKDVYPYFAFDFDDDDSERYDFRLTFWASSVTWACELAASLCLRLLIRWCYGVDVGREGRLDLAVWPELLPTSVAVMLHVLQNMLFSIIRLQFQLQ
ncbi:DNA repair protein rhp7 [Verticillium dahliae VDG2]|nr:DNA repair protein rhp7 [Verticillium dahliae VDG2]